MISKDKVIVHISMEKEVLEALNIIVKVLRQHGLKVNKSTFLVSLFLKWMDKEYDKALLKEEKENA